MEKPVLKLIGCDSNIFYIMSHCSRALKRCGRDSDSSELISRVWECETYDDALRVCLEYVDIE